jgi:hypothetical protein
MYKLPHLGDAGTLVSNIAADEFAASQWAIKKHKRRTAV